MRQKRTCVELCAGGGGSSIGLEQAGFEHTRVVERNPTFCETLERNRPGWGVVCADLGDFDARGLGDVDLLSGGLPCPPFSIAGQQLGSEDERDCFPMALRIVRKIRPKSIMFENVPGLLQPKFELYRKRVTARLARLGYGCGWHRVVSSDLGVPQHRPRTLLVGLLGRRPEEGPMYRPRRQKTVTGAIRDIMGENGWRGLGRWSRLANGIAPTVTGGSERHGGPDLGPTRARKAWALMGIDGMGIADEPPARDFVGMPRLTLRMVARIQSFPDRWRFAGTKTAVHRQIGNALPAPVAKAAGIFVRGQLD